MSFKLTIDEGDEITFSSLDDAQSMYQEAMSNADNHSAILKDEAGSTIAEFQRG